MSIVQETLRELDRARAESPRALVAFSGGKDSLVVMDMATRTFDSVVAFFMYLVPGLKCAEAGIEAALQRWGNKIERVEYYPHWLTSKLIRNGEYCDFGSKAERMPEWKLNDVYSLAMRDSGIPFVLTGAKAADSGWRRRFMTTAYRDAIRNPIAKWHKYDVLAYLRARNIPEPASSGKSATGIDLSVPSLLSTLR